MKMQLETTPVVLTDRWGTEMRVPLQKQSQVDRIIKAIESDARARSAYAASESNRLNANWVATNEAINTILNRELSTLRARSRYLEQNNPYGIAAINTLLNFCVGTGFELQMQVARVERTDTGFQRVELDAFNDYVEDLFATWGLNVTGNAPINSPESLFEIQNLIMRRFAVDGEVFIHIGVNKGHPVVPFILEVIDANNVGANITEYKGNPVFLGIEVDKNTWQPVAYWVYSVKNQDPQFQSQMGATRIPAENMIHVFKKHYPYQLRGIPFCAGVAQKFFDIEEYNKAQIVRSKLAAMFGLLLAGGKGGGLLTDSSYDAESDNTNSLGFPVDANGNIIAQMGPGIIGRVAEGVTPHMVTPTAPEGGNYDPFLRHQLRALGAGHDVGLSYTGLTRDSSKTTFAGGRQEENRDFQGYRPFMKLFGLKALSPIFRPWMDTAVLSGALLDGVGTDYEMRPEFWQRHAWMPGGWSRGINPLQEVNASAKSMELNITTLADECAALGRDWKIQLAKGERVAEGKLQQYARLKEKSVALGISDKEFFMLMGQSEMAGPLPLGYQLIQEKGEKSVDPAELELRREMEGEAIQLFQENS